MLGFEKENKRMKRAIHRLGQKKVLHHLHWWWALIRHKKLTNTKPISIGSALPFSFLGSFFYVRGYRKQTKKPGILFHSLKKKERKIYNSGIRSVNNANDNFYPSDCLHFFFIFLDGLFISASIKFFIIICRLFSAALGFFESTFRTIPLVFLFFFRSLWVKSG